MLTPSQIREYREREGLTLRAVEKYAGITAANIGQLESAASVALLRKITVK